ncbi:MAG: S8 family serine peptidase, partial [Bacteroidota bacterium]
MNRAMRRTSVIVFLSLSILLGADAQLSGRQWVFFNDKAASVPADAHSLIISDRALQRRAKVLSPDRLLDELDLPVAPAYLQALSATGVRVRTVSRWLNAASVEKPSVSAESAVRALPFVGSLRPVLATRRQPLKPSEPPVPSFRKSGTRSALSYGTSQTQNANIHALALHDAGVIGVGVFVGMLDDGFNYHREHPALRSIRVVAEYDFIQRDSNTSVQAGEAISQGYHGSATLGTLAGYLPGSLIGPAYGATLALGKTEIDSIEVIQEEDNYVQGLEWMEALGVDIISTSVGYIDWYTYAQLDGATAITTKAARTLARKGVLLVTAMGNEGNFVPSTTTTGTLIAPADTDSIVSVGATISDGIVTGFSS